MADMFEPHSIKISRLTCADLDGFRRIARADRSFEARFEVAARLGFQALLRPTLDPEARFGLRLATDEALLCLAATPTETRGQSVRKGDLLRAWTTDPSPNAALARIFRAAIEAETLALEVRPRCRLVAEATR